jgi:hypothetical protein
MHSSFRTHTHTHTHIHAYKVELQDAGACSRHTHTHIPDIKFSNTNKQARTDLKKAQAASLTQHMLRLRDVCGRVRLGVELAVVDCKRLGVQETAEAFLQRMLERLHTDIEACMQVYGYDVTGVHPDLSENGANENVENDASISTCRAHDEGSAPNSCSASEHEDGNSREKNNNNHVSGGNDGVSGGGEAGITVSMRSQCVQTERQCRAEFLRRQQHFVHELCALSSALKLRPKGATRDEMLRERLLELNRGLPDGVYVPLGNSGARQSAVCALPLKHAFCLSTYDKVLYVCMNAAVGF